MSQVARCPHCDSQSVLPVEFELGASIQCPACSKPYTLDAQSLLQLPTATLMPASEPAPSAPLAAKPADTQPPVVLPVEPSVEPSESRTEPVLLSERPVEVPKEPSANITPLSEFSFPKLEAEPTDTHASSAVPRKLWAGAPIAEEGEPPAEKSVEPEANMPQDRELTSSEDNGSGSRDPALASLLDQLRGVGPMPEEVVEKSMANTSSAPLEPVRPAMPEEERLPTKPQASEPPLGEIAQSPDIEKSEETISPQADPLGFPFALPKLDVSADNPPAIETTPDSVTPDPVKRGFKERDFSIGLADAPPAALAVEVETEPSRIDPTTPTKPRDVVDAEASSAQSPSRSSWNVGRVATLAAGALVGLGLGYGILIGFGGSGYDSLGLLTALQGESSTPAMVAEPGETTSPSAISPADELSPPMPFVPDASGDTIPASFNAPSNTPAEFEPADQPIALTPETAVQGPVGPRPSHDHNALAVSLVGANAAKSELASLSLSDGHHEAVGRSYAKLCEVANVLSSLEDDSTHSEMRMTRLQAQDLFRQLFRYAHVREDTRLVAQRWVSWNQRAHGGVFFAGEPKGMVKIGSVFETRFTLSDGQEVVVLCEESFAGKRFKDAVEIGIVGEVVDSPATQIQGYTGEAEQAVWAARTYALKAAEFE